MTLRELRSQASLRQEDIGKKLNVDQGAVSKWENGKTHPSKKYHRKLANIYGITVDELKKAVGTIKD